MTHEDRQVLFTAVAYAVVFSATVHALAHQEIEQKQNTDYRLSLVPKIARQIEELCKDALPTSFADESEVAKIDIEIDEHIEELHVEGSAVLPQDRATLVKFYSRLYQRKANREHAAFYDMADENMLSTAIQKFLDEEITFKESGI